MTFPAVRFGGGARIRRPSSQSEIDPIDREHRMGIEDPDLDVAEQQLPLTDLDEDAEELPEPGQLPVEADPADFADQHRGVPVIDEDSHPVAIAAHRA